MTELPSKGLFDLSRRELLLSTSGAVAGIVSGVATSLVAYDVLGPTVSGNKKTKNPNNGFLPPVIRLAGWGDSIIYGGGSGSFSCYELAIRQGRSRFIDCGNFGIPGENSEQILNRLQSVIDADPNVCIINPGTNDIDGKLPEENLKANLKACYSELIEAGIAPLDIGLFPTNDDNNVPARVLNNIWRRHYCMASGIRTVDVWPRTATPKGNFKPGMNLSEKDGVHPSPHAASLVADDLIDMLTTGSVADVISAPLLAYTDIGSHHQGPVENAVSFQRASNSGIADDWTAYGENGQYDVIASDAHAFGSWLRCNVSGGENVGFTSVTKRFENLSWKVGDVLACGFLIRASGGLDRLNQVFNGMTADGAFTDTRMTSEGGTWGIYHEARITAGTACGIRFFASGNGYFDISRPVVINLTQLGLQPMNPRI